MLVTQQDRPLAYHATLEHIQWMMGTDAQYLAKLVPNGSMDFAVAAAIFRDYRVSRTIRHNGTSNNGPASKRLAQMIFDKISTWPTSLVERAQFCRDIAMNFRGESKSSPYSAVTKLCWFLRPHDWTMFDNYARMGLDRGTIDIVEFYRVLDAHGFSDKAADMNATMKAAGFDGLYAERVIDKFLMMRGIIVSKRTRDEAMAERRRIGYHNDLFLKRLGELHPLATNTAEAIANLAAEMGRLLPDDSFVTKNLARRLKKLNLNWAHSVEPRRPTTSASLQL